MSKKLILLVTIIFMILFFMIWFIHEKDEIEHNECFGFENVYTYTQKKQIEEVLYRNRNMIEELITNMSQYPGTYSVVLSEIDEYIKQENDFVKDNKDLLLEFYENSKMDYILFFGENNRCQIYQEIPQGKVVSLKLCGIIDANNHFEWEIVNTSSNKYCSLNLYNLLYN